jgi:hypothetical protein
MMEDINFCFKYQNYYYSVFVKIKNVLLRIISLSSFGGKIGCQFLLDINRQNT